MNSEAQRLVDRLWNEHLTRNPSARTQYMTNAGYRRDSLMLQITLITVVDILNAQSMSWLAERLVRGVLEEMVDDRKAARLDPVSQLAELIRRDPGVLDYLNQGIPGAQPSADYLQLVAKRQAATSPESRQ